MLFCWHLEINLGPKKVCLKVMKFPHHKKAGFKKNCWVQKNEKVSKNKKFNVLRTLFLGNSNNKTTTTTSSAAKTTTTTGIKTTRINSLKKEVLFQKSFSCINSSQSTTWKFFIWGLMVRFLLAPVPFSARNSWVWET